MSKLHEAFSIARDYTCITLLCGTAYCALLVGTVSIANRLSERIDTQEQLERIVKEEKGAFIERTSSKSVIIPQLVSGTAGYSRSSEQGHILCIGGEYATRSIVRHELYDIYDGHCCSINEICTEFSTEDGELGTIGSLVKNAAYYLWWEPQAIIYQTTGIQP